MPLLTAARKVRRIFGAISESEYKANTTIGLFLLTDDLSVARKCFRMGIAPGGNAKQRDMSHQSGERTGMQKIKKQRNADWVVPPSDSESFLAAVRKYRGQNQDVSIRQCLTAATAD